MNSIDMIPQSYREQLRVRLWGRNFLAAMGALLLMIGAAKVGLLWTLSVQKPQLEKLQLGRQAVSAQLAQVEALRARKSEAEQNVAVLATLRGGPSVEQLSATIDHAINDGVWFSELQFVRSADYAAPSPGDGDHGASGGNTETTTQPPLNQLTIKGQAHSHSALAQFAKNLAAQPGTRNVRVVNTARRGDSALDAVQFEIAAVVNGAARVAK